MISFRVSAEVADSRQLLISLPPEVPTGKAELTITVAPLEATTEKPPRTSLADWADANSEHLGDSVRSDEVEEFTGRRF